MTGVAALLLSLSAGCRDRANNRPNSDGGVLAAGPSAPFAASPADGGRGEQRAADTAPDLLVWAADLAVREGDLPSARRLLSLSLAKLGGTLSVQPAAGLLDAALPVSFGPGQSPSGEPAAELFAELTSDVAANGSMIAIAHGSLLSAIDLRKSYRLLRLASHPATIRQVKLSPDGRRVATFADDQILRLFSLPTGALVLELPLGLDFFSLGERRHAELFAFSPDSRRLFALDCGERSGPACPLLRLRSFACERGERHSEIALPAEPIDYTSRSDGTLALLPTGDVPRFYDAGSGMEWPQQKIIIADKNSVAGQRQPEATGGEAALKQCQAQRFVTSRGRQWLISPERHFLLTLASPALLCLWDVAEHKLTRAIALPRPPAVPVLLSLLAEARVAIIGDGKNPAGKNPPGQPMLAELFELATAAPGAANRKPQRLPYPLSVLPLDSGGALWTVAPPATVRAAPGETEADTDDDRDDVAAVLDGELCLLAGEPVAERAAERAAERGFAARCLKVPSLWRQADPRVGPLATSGDGRFALFGSKWPLLVDTQKRGSSRVATTISLPAAATSGVLENAEVLDDGRLVTLHATGELRVYNLPAAELSYSPAAPIELLRLSQKDDALHIERLDGSSLWLSLEGASLRRTVPPPGMLPTTRPATSLVPTLSAGDAKLFVLPGGAVSFIDRRPSALRLRIQFLPDDTGGGGDKRAPAAVVIASDGRFERLGDATLADIEPYVICRAGPYQAPLAVCAERLESKGLLTQSLALFKTAKPAAVRP